MRYGSLGCLYFLHTSDHLLQRILEEMKKPPTPHYGQSVGQFAVWFWFALGVLHSPHRVREGSLQINVRAQGGMSFVFMIYLQNLIEVRFRAKHKV